MEKAKARTFFDDKTVEVEVLSQFGDSGLYKTMYLGHDIDGASMLVRHRNRLEPLNEEARILLKK